MRSGSAATVRVALSTGGCYTILRAPIIHPNVRRHPLISRDQRIQELCSPECSHSNYFRTPSLKPTRVDNDSSTKLVYILLQLLLFFLRHERVARKAEVVLKL